MSSSKPLVSAAAAVETTVIVVGAGPSGMSTAACLTRNSVPYVLLEREDCLASLWRKKTYDRLHLHLTKEFCQLPHLQLPNSLPSYLPRDDFLRYLDDYAQRFRISPVYQREVKLARYNEEGDGKWHVKVRMINDSTNNLNAENKEELYVARFLVVATGETSDAFVPKVDGMEGFEGKAVHSTQYKTGKEYQGKRVLVVGSGNSGMEIALDLANHGAHTSIVVRSPVHVLSRGMVYTGLKLLKYRLPLSAVDWLMVTLSKLRYGDLKRHGIDRPTEGPFFMKVVYGKYPVIDVGTLRQIQTGHIKVLPALANIKGNDVIFENGESYPFDAIIFATGFKRSTHTWLLGDDYLLNEDGIPKPSFPNHWKGKKGLYCAGLGRNGLYGAAFDGQNIADDIKSLL